MGRGFPALCIWRARTRQEARSAPEYRHRVTRDRKQIHNGCETDRNDVLELHPVGNCSQSRGGEGLAKRGQLAREGEDGLVNPMLGRVLELPCADFNIAAGLVTELRPDAVRKAEP